MNFIIRHYQKSDNSQIKEINFYFSLLYANHKDFLPENIFVL